jgi:8-oxo-dGTP pyrophosphatase MutT (NUDIX family)
MSQQKELPTLRGEHLYIPFVGAIIEREKDGVKQVLVQTRDKETDTVYSGSIEIPGGKFRAFEDVYTTVRREAKEESGLDITFISGEMDRKNYPNREDISSLIEPFCITQMSNGPFIGMIFLCKAEGEPLQKTNETKEAKWIDVEELKKIVKEQPERIYTAFLGPLKKYIGE